MITIRKNIQNPSPHQLIPVHSKKLTGSQLSPPHETNKKLKCETKNKTMSMIGPVQSRCHKGSPIGKISLRWEGFVEKVGFEPVVEVN